MLTVQVSILGLQVKIMSQKVAKLIADARMRAGMSQADLADKVGISRQAVAAWEKGNSGPKRKFVMKVAAALHLQPSDIDPLMTGSVQKVELGLEHTPILLLSSSDVPHVTKGSELLPALKRLSADKLYVSAELAHCFAVEVATDEMNPEYQTQDICIIDPTLKPNHGDDVLITIEGQRSMLRRVNIRGTDASGFLVMDLVTPNVNLPTMTLTRATGAMIVGVVVEQRKRRRLLGNYPPPPAY